jgi:hypothetical protein
LRTCLRSRMHQGSLNTLMISSTSRFIGVSPHTACK